MNKWMNEWMNEWYTKFHNKRSFRNREESKVERLEIEKFMRLKILMDSKEKKIKWGNARSRKSLSFKLQSD